jgi:hypothetical protein
VYEKKPEFGRFFHVFSIRQFFFKNDPIRANFQRFPDPESGNRSVCIEAKIENFLDFLPKNG